MTKELFWVPDRSEFNRSPFLTVCMKVSWMFYGVFKTRNVQERLETFRNGEWQGQFRIWIVCTITFTLTLQKRKNYCKSFVFNRKRDMIVIVTFQNQVLKRNVKHFYELSLNVTVTFSVNERFTIQYLFRFRLNFENKRTSVQFSLIHW